MPGKKARTTATGTVRSSYSPRQRGRLKSLSSSQKSVRPVVWDDANRKHLEEDHPERAITLAEIEQALNDSERQEKYNRQRDNYVWADGGRPSTPDYLGTGCPR